MIASRPRPGCQARGRPPAALILALGLLLSLTGCPGGGDDQKKGRLPIPPPLGPGPVGFRGTGLPNGTLYVAAGNEGSADLYRAKGAVDRAQRLTGGARISLMSGGRRSLVIAWAPDGGPDRVSAADLTGRRRPLPGRTLDTAGQAPEVSARGLVAYTQPQFTDRNEDGGTRVLVRSLRGGPARVSFRSSTSDLNVGWTSAGELMVQPIGTNEIVVDPAGPRRRTIDVRLSAVDSFRTSSRGDTYALGTREEVAVIEAGGRQLVFKTSWAPVAWSPDGSGMLALQGGRLGVMSPTTGRVREVARVRGGTIADAAWLE